MPRLTFPSDLGRSAPPAASRTCFETLAQALDGVIPAKTADNLLIGTWNIALLGGLTQKWTTERRDSPKRNLTDICCLAEIVSRFDVCAVQETQRSLVALRTLIRALGQSWRFITTDVTEGTRGKSERLVYVYDESRVRLSGLAGELVIPEQELGLTPGALDRQFARTPFAVSFITTRHAKAFTLVTLHIWFGDHPSERRPELQATADWLARRAGQDDEFNRNMIALGDFNIDRRGDENWQAFASAGLGPPQELNDVPRNIAHRTAGAKFYDQIAWFNEGNRRMLTLGYTTAGTFMWTDHIAGFRDNIARKARISDHYPLWAEFSLV